MIKGGLNKCDKKKFSQGATYPFKKKNRIFIFVQTNFRNDDTDEDDDKFYFELLTQRSNVFDMKFI